MTQPRKRRYLVGKTRRPTPAVAPLDATALPDVSLEQLNQTLTDGELDVQALSRLLGQTAGFEVLESAVSARQTPILVVAASDDRAAALRKAYGSRVVVEPDELLELFPATATRGRPNVLPPMAAFTASVAPLDEDVLDVTVTVSGGDPAVPVERAEVHVMGSLWVAQGHTDADGRVQLELFGETAQSLRALYVKPRDTYWSRYIDDPSLDDLDVVLTALDAYPPGQSGERFDWGHRAMNMHRVPDEWRGRGVKVAVIDSGCTDAHDDLTVDHGFDFTEGAADPEHSWRDDTVGHGSHVTGTIAARRNGTGIMGFASEAEVHALKVFPGGRFSDLIASLDRCIDLQIDVVNLSLGSDSRSVLLEDALAEATDAGIACIAAAGNSGAEIQYPAAYPDVLAVAAIGRRGTFPDDSQHARQAGEAEHDGAFVARFTCFSGERGVIDVCAPGVAITSCVPTGPSRYAAWDGTSMACPHVVGLATLLLQARPELRDHPRDRQRVAALFAALKASSRSLGLPATHQGSGMPDARLAFDLAPEAADDAEPWSRLASLLDEAIEIVRAEAGERS